MREVLKDMKAILPKEKMQLLEENLDTSNPEDRTRSNGDLCERRPEEQAEASKANDFIQFESQGKSFTIKKGLSRDEEVRLLQMIFDCGGILKTIVKTHDINLKNNAFLREFFSLTFDHKKECHDVNNALVGLASKIKSIQ